MKTEHEARAIRAELAQLVHRGQGRRYPEALRARMIAYPPRRELDRALIRQLGA